MEDLLTYSKMKDGIICLRKDKNLHNQLEILIDILGLKRSFSCKCRDDVSKYDILFKWSINIVYLSFFLLSCFLITCVKWKRIIIIQQSRDKSIECYICNSIVLLPWEKECKANSQKGFEIVFWNIHH